MLLGWAAGAIFCRQHLAISMVGVYHHGLQQPYFFMTELPGDPASPRLHWRSWSVPYSSGGFAVGAAELSLPALYL